MEQTYFSDKTVKLPVTIYTQISKLCPAAVNWKKLLFHPKANFICPGGVV
jgi:hypothetical protein